LRLMCVHLTSRANRTRRLCSILRPW
jgi:hypothetical protein